MKFAKGTARVLIEDSPDTMTVDYRRRCVVQTPTHDVIVYGHTCLDYATQHPAGGGVIEAKDVRDGFDHSAGRGKRALGPGATVERPPHKHFFTPGIGRAEELILRRKRALS